MASLVREGALSPVELVEALLRQIASCNPAINAFVTLRAEEARAEARRSEAAVKRGDALGLLHGVPVTVKDSFDVAGLPTQSGSRLRSATPAAEDAPAVARLRSAGAIVLGKTNTPEMLANFETDNFLTGRTNNPWDLGRTPGGSSGGEAAAIASFCSAGGIATDGGGSIRVPAHFCGIAGLKPTPGRVPAGGHFPSLGYPTGLLTVAGPMARDARDLRLLFSVLAGYDECDPFSVPVPLREPSAAGARIGVWEQFYGVPAAPEIRAAVRQAASWMESAGFAVDSFDPAGLDRAPNVWAFLFKWPLSAIRQMAEGRQAEMHWTLQEALDPAESTANQVMLNLAARDRLRAALLRQLETRAAVILPVCGIPAFPHRQRKFSAGESQIGLFQAMMPAVLANVLGLPAVTVPIALTAEGLPIGIQLMGRPYQDEVLLELAIRLEEARGAWTAAPVSLL
jgi:Asp-tRNA(Asn)/Glu-tRNA(Gln) amidotransferase A subunit family amidase